MTTSVLQSTTGTVRWAWLERVGLVTFAAAVYSIYFPLSRYVASLEPNTPISPVDTATPLQPGWIFVYVMVFMAGLLPALVVKHTGLFRRVVAGCLAIQLVAFAAFVIFPVHMSLRPVDVSGSGFTAWGLRLCYYLDAPTCCFPSLHVSMALYAAAATWKVDRLVGGLAGVLALLICASTMFVKQHFLADVLAGAMLAGCCYAVFVGSFKIRGMPAAALRFPRRYPAVLPVLYSVAIASCYLLFRMGYAPWEGR